ncbi:hypothetical protein HPP92_004724 [Vanilla planifolia]|uniref:Uncharacterized protein n=1 Tax=Vanilla planifolia TaxID=51239 RepID=A0A835RM24_VANPL|nr:hypothetical protein HPP92_004724 [Vanilla planifolia]
MASAILASRNEPYWAEPKVYMRKPPCSNPNPRLDPNPNPSIVPKSSNRGSYDANVRTPNDDVVMAAGMVLSEDSSSLNRKSTSLNHRRDASHTSTRFSYVSFNISTCTRNERRELKRRLVAELEQVRSVSCRIESRDLQSSARSVGHSVSGIYCTGREVTSPAPVHQSQLALADSYTRKEQAFQSAKTVMLPVVLHKQEPFSQPEVKQDSVKLLSGMMKKCGQILSKLMRQKGGVWFNSPVDVEGMGLHDYRQIIKTPMDLGTVRSRLNNGFYLTPLDFAGDIRLTFRNALIYNPETHEVHKLASHLNLQFEGLFGPAYAKYEKQKMGNADSISEKQLCNSWSDLVPVNGPIPEPPPVSQPGHVAVPVQQQLQSKLVAPPALSTSWPQTHPQQQQFSTAVRKAGGKLPKPKAKDPNKRPMSYEERQKLSLGLQSLPPEKMNQVIFILRRRNVDTQQDGDEIVLDFETMDTETLWELDRFLCNCKKMLSKIKRQEALAGSMLCSAAGSHSIDGDHKLCVEDDAPEALALKSSKKGDPGDEDVDIGEDLPSTNYPTVVIEKDDGNGSCSSSSGSESSSSSDSESGSSSGSDSDDEDPHSPVAALRSPPRN